jgi:hypothetical protein
MDIPCPHCAVYAGIPCCHNPACPLLCDCIPRVGELVRQHGALNVEEALLINYGQMVARAIRRAHEEGDATRETEAQAVLQGIAYRLFQIDFGRGENPRT